MRRQFRAINRSTSAQTRIKRNLSIVIPVHEPVLHLPMTIRRLLHWAAVKEVIVVANGMDESKLTSLRTTGARVIHYPMPLGHDTPRAVGAHYALGRYILFIDADIRFQIRELQPFLQTLKQGADIALNHYPNPDFRRYHHPTAVAKRALNLVLERPDLKAASLTAIPHAIRKSAVNQIGVQYLAAPPVFQAIAAMEGLRIETAAHVPVGLRNQRRSKGSYPYRIRDLIIGDHIEAIHYVQQKLGSRGHFPDELRQRSEIPQSYDSKPNNQNAMTTVAVMPAKNEASTISTALHHLKAAGASTVYVVDNGSRDDTSSIARRQGATVQTYRHALGHDVGRSIGAGLAQSVHAQCTLFIDADFAIPPSDLRPFVKAVREDGVDLALNHLSRGLGFRQQRDAVSTMKRFLNLALHRPDLGTSSPTAIPHALSRKALDTLSPYTLAVPPVLLVQAVLSQLNIQPVHFVDVIRPNRYRRTFHARKGSSGKEHLITSAPLTRLILGDHLEALELWTAQKGNRGGFVQPRRLDVLNDLLKNPGD